MTAAVPVGASPPKYMSVVARRSSVNISPPSASRKRTRAPGEPVRGLTISASGSSWIPFCTTARGAYRTSTPSPRAARIPSSGVTTCSGMTVALPPPCVRASTALCPMTATLRSADASSGRAASSLRTSTVPAAAAARANATPSSTWTGSGATASKPSSAPTRAARRSRRITLRSMSDSSTRPSRTASRSGSPHAPTGPGISRSCEARAASTLRTPVQSLTTTPSNPHSELSGVSSRSFSVDVTPLIEL